MNNNKAIIGILITVVVILSSIIAFLFCKNSLEIRTSKHGGYNHDRYINVSESNGQLQNGIECRVLMKAQINNGGNSDDYGVLYGKLYKDEKVYRHGFILKTDGKDKIVLTYANSESPEVFDGIKYEFDMFKDTHGLRGTSEDRDEPRSRYIFFQGPEFRLVEISSMEGSFMTISRGVCVEST